MKDFDIQRQERKDADRDFHIGGETFTLKTGVRPEVIAKYEEITGDTPATAVIAAFDTMIIDMIEPDDDAAKRWRDLREREDDPLTLDDIGELVKWAMGEMAGRPTQQSSPSPAGRGRTGTTSTGASSSPGEKAA